MNLTIDKTENHDFFARVKSAGLKVSAEKVVFELRNCAVVIASQMKDELGLSVSDRNSYELILGAVALQIGMVETPLINGDLGAQSKHLVETAQQILLSVKPVVGLAR